MRNLFIFSVFVLVSMQIRAQDSITLGFRSDAQLDSIRIENLDTGDDCLLAGMDSIVFTFGSPEIIDTSVFVGVRPSIISEPRFYPNPCNGKASFQFTSGLPTMVNMAVYDLAGNKLVQMKNSVARGSHCYGLSFDRPGMHFVQITTSSGTYAAPLVNLGGSAIETGIFYEGAGRSPGIRNRDGDDQRFSKSLLAPEDSTDLLPASRGDLLRFCAYSDSSMEMVYDFLDEDSTYLFTFPDVPAGVYLQSVDDTAFLSDTIYCFAAREGYLFSQDTARINAFSRERILLQPVSFGAAEKPVYRWEIGNQEVWTIDTSAYAPGVLSPVIPKAGRSGITLHDVANGFSREFILIMEADDFVGDGIALTKIKNESTLDEISGMAASIKNPGYFWVHNDSGDEARIFLINTEGQIVCTVKIDTDFTDNRDWEDIAVGPGPEDEETYIYIGEIGDLNRNYSNKFIFRIIEPQVDTTVLNQTLNIARIAVSTMKYDYEDGSRDAEILLIDPLTKDLFIITKREENVQIYEFSFSHSPEEKVILTKSSVTLPFRLTNGGDISADGKEILVKNLTHVYYYKRQDGESIIDALSRPGERLPYIKEPQGESIAWFRDGSAYLTVSEKKDGITPVIYKYIRRW